MNPAHESIASNFLFDLVVLLFSVYIPDVVFSLLAGKNILHSLKRGTHAVVNVVIAVLPIAANTV